MTLPQIAQASPSDLAIVRALMTAQLQEVHDLGVSIFGWHFDVAALMDQRMAQIGELMPPNGRVLLARQDMQFVGCFAVATLSSGIGELRRMYVSPDHRRSGIGGALLDAALAECRAMSFASVYLESPPFLESAHRLYRSRGFVVRTPYEGTQIEREYHDRWMWMGLQLRYV